MEAAMKRAILHMALLTFSALVAAQEHPSLEEVLKLSRERGYLAGRIAWDDVEARARALASTQSEDAAIGFVLRSLGDRHSFYVPPRGLSGATQNSAPSVQQPPRSISRAAEPIEAVPIIHINAWSGTYGESVAAVATLRSHLVSALENQECGVILDFSNNTGGNMWPMLVGLSPVLTEGVLGYFRDAHGVDKEIEKRGDKIFFNGSSHVLNAASAQQPESAARRIAVIVGPRSSSSGEIVPIMFTGQENVQVFGRPTSGRSTANSTFTLPNGGLANITTAVTVNRHGKVFDSQVEPDTLTDNPGLVAARWVASACQRR